MNNSEAAAPTTVHQAQANILAKQDNERQRKWFQSGKDAKKKGFQRLSPFYENSTADYFFFCGWDGVSFEEAQSALKEKIKQIFEQDSTVKQTVEELVK